MLSLKTLDILSAIVFSTPGMWLEEIQKSLFSANPEILFVVLLQRTENMPPILLIYAIAVLLSVKIWTCLTLQLCLKHNFRANKMDFSSKTLKWFLSKESATNWSISIYCTPSLFTSVCLDCAVIWYILQ